MKQIAIINTGYKSYAYEREIFASHGYELIIFEGERLSGDQAFQFAKNAEGILVRDRKVGAREMDQMPLLKAIVRYGVGYDNINLEAARERKIRVANVQGYANHSVSDHAMALMFACTRNLMGNRPGSFGIPPREEILELHNKTLGIIGIGRIGSTFARKASPLFKRTLACDPYQSVSHMNGLNVQKVDLKELLMESHVVSIHCNLTEETRHMLNAHSFQEMIRKPVIINTARGPIVEESALLHALNEGKLHSAGLDVFENEPPGEAQQALLAHPLIVSTPHVAWYSENAIQLLQKGAIENMIGLLKGNPIEDEL